MKVVDGRVSLTVGECVKLYWMLGQAMEHLDDKRLRLVMDSEDARRMGDANFAKAAIRVVRRVSRKFGAVAAFRARLAACVEEMSR
jgi:hypothetical protein